MSHAASGKGAATKQARPSVASSRFLAARVYALSIVLRRVTNLVTKRDSGLSHDKARVIILLGEYQPLLLGDLVARSALDQGQLSRGVSELVKEGMVERTRRGRIAELRLTEAGMEVYAELLKAAEARNAELLQDFTKEQAERLYRDLETVILRAEAMFERERE